MRIFCIAKDSHIFPTKNNSIFIYILNFNETLTNDVINFKQPVLVSRHCNMKFIVRLSLLIMFEEEYCIIPILVLSKYCFFSTLKQLDMGIHNICGYNPKCVMSRILNGVMCVERYTSSVHP